MPTLGFRQKRPGGNSTARLLLPNPRDAHGRRGHSMVSGHRVTRAILKKRKIFRIQPGSSIDELCATRQQSGHRCLRRPIAASRLVPP